MFYRNRRSGPLGTFIIGIVFIVTGYFVAFYFGKPELEEAKASQNWPATKGMIERSEVVRQYSNRKTMYSADVVYSYTVEGQKYESNQVRFGGDVRSSSSSSAYKTSRGYPKGKTVDVYYNPKEPAVAVLEAGPNFYTYGLFYGGLGFLGIGVFLVLSPLFKLFTLLLGLAFAGFKR